jgi:hypothetical protein
VRIEVSEGGRKALLAIASAPLAWSREGDLADAGEAPGALGPEGELVKAGLVARWDRDRLGRPIGPFVILTPLAAEALGVEVAESWGNPCWAEAEAPPRGGRRARVVAGDDELRSAGARPCDRPRKPRLWERSLVASRVERVAAEQGKVGLVELAVTEHLSRIGAKEDEETGAVVDAKGEAVLKIAGVAMVVDRRAVARAVERSLRKAGMRAS